MWMEIKMGCSMKSNLDWEKNERHVAARANVTTATEKAFISTKSAAMIR
jgi:hypothetical protein